MIDLFSVKINNTYDFVQDTVPTTDGTWLCSDDITGYTKGYSYQVTYAESVATVTRIEAISDLKILSNIHGTIERVCNYLNNWFYIPRNRDFIDSIYSDYDASDYQWSTKLSKDFFAYESDCNAKYTFTANTINPVTSNIFMIGDLVQVRGTKRNNVNGYITNIIGDTITIDNELRVTAESGFIFLMDIPKDVERIISGMISYDVFYRAKPTDMKSETIGNYSYTKDTTMIGGISYPSEYASTLYPYKRVMICQ